MRTCTHEPAEHRHYDGDRCFECWRADRNDDRARFRAELERLIAHGVTLAETWPSGKNVTDWSMDLASGASMVYHHDSGNRTRPGTRTAAGIAEHLENRHDGFATTLHAYCVHCGEALIELAIGQVPDRPTCQDCGNLPAVIRAEADAKGYADRMAGYEPWKPLNEHQRRGYREGYRRACREIAASVDRAAALWNGPSLT